MPRLTREDRLVAVLLRCSLGGMRRACLVIRRWPYGQSGRDAVRLRERDAEEMVDIDCGFIF